MAPADAGPGSPGTTSSPPKRRRSLRAVFAADIAGFSGRMSLNETSTVDLLGEILTIGRSELDKHEGWLFGMPGDGLFATFESAINAVQCALALQIALAERPRLAEMPLRIGIHMGEVLLHDGIPYGETLNIAARLESLAEPGGILVSGTVMDAVSARVSATFEARGTPQLKNIPRRVPTFAVTPPPAREKLEQEGASKSSLDRTARFDPAALSGEASVAPAPSDEASAAKPAAAVGSPPATAEHLPLDEIARAAKAAAAAQEASLNQLMGDASPAGAPDNPQAGSATHGNTPQLPDEFVKEITKAFAEFIGPFAKMIVTKHLKAKPSGFELISELEQHIPTEQERITFRLRASQINQSFGLS